MVVGLHPDALERRGRDIYRLGRISDTLFELIKTLFSCRFEPSDLLNIFYYKVLSHYCITVNKLFFLLSRK